MERSEILEAMGGLKLFGMRAAYDEIVATAVKRQYEPQRVVGDLLSAELSEKQARSIRYQIAVAKLPLAKQIEEFVFTETPINETLVRDLAAGARHCPRTNGGSMARPRPSAQPRAGRRHGNRQDPSRRRHRPGLHP
jgi:hypothetical protein